MNTPAPSLFRDLLDLAARIFLAVLLIVGIAFAFASHAASAQEDLLATPAPALSESPSQASVPARDGNL